jgi:hypothetical protein
MHIGSIQSEERPYVITVLTIWKEEGRKGKEGEGENSTEGHAILAFACVLTKAWFFQRKVKKYPWDQKQIFKCCLISTEPRLQE